MVRAKFYVTGKTHNPATEQSGESYNISLNSVINGSEENKEFFKYTPSASISMSTVNPAAAAQFEEGKEYYVDFTPAE